MGIIVIFCYILHHFEGLFIVGVKYFMVKKFILILIVLMTLAVTGWYWWMGRNFIDPLVGERDKTALPLEKYDFDSLRNSLKVSKSESLKYWERSLKWKAGGKIWD